MRNNIILAVIIILALTLSVSAQHPRDMQFDPLKFDPPKPERFVTDNGMIIYFMEDHQLPVIMGSIIFHGGDCYDPEDKIGLASVCASLMRSGGAGSRTPDQVDADLDYIGASISSGSGNEALQLNFRCLIKDVELTYEILSDIAQKPMFDSSKVALVISNMQDEIRRQNDHPGLVTRRIYYETIYTGHPYGKNPTLASLNNIARNDLFDQHKKYYAPNNCTMAIAGDMTSDQLKELLNKYFGGWIKTEINIEEIPQATMQYAPGIYYAERDINQAIIRFGHLGMDSKNPDRHAFEVMNFALGGGGFTSRLLNQVRSTAGLAYSVGSYQLLRPYMGTFFAYCQTRANAMGQALTMMKKIIDDVVANGITEQELEIAKESIVNSYVFGFDTPGKIVGAQANLEFFGYPPDQLEKDLEAYQAVTLEDCNQAAKKYIQLENWVLVITGNQELFDQPMEDFGPVTNVSLEIK